MAAIPKINGFYRTHKFQENMIQCKTETYLQRIQLIDELLPRRQAKGVYNNSGLIVKVFLHPNTKKINEAHLEIGVSFIQKEVFFQLVIVYFIVNKKLHFRNIVYGWLPRLKLGIEIEHGYRKHCLHLILYDSYDPFNLKKNLKY